MTVQTTISLVILTGIGFVLGRYLITNSKAATGPRGLRNNNPGNIKHGNNQWLGMSAQQTDPTFVQFDSPEMGIRAIARTLNTYYYRHNRNTVRKIISRWAPEDDDNPTDTYITAVSTRLQVGPDDILVLEDVLQLLVESIIRFELGQQPYPPQVLAVGVQAATAVVA